MSMLHVQAGHARVESIVTSTLHVQARGKPKLSAGPLLPCALKPLSACTCSATSTLFAEHESKAVSNVSRTACMGG